MSLKERMSALESTKKESHVSDKIEALKAQRDVHAVKGSSISSKDKIAGLFADKIEKQKKSAASSAVSGSKGKMLKEALKNPEPEKAAEIVQELGLFVAMEKKPDYRKNKADNENDCKAEEKK
eukprot:152728_1